jgi:hypothetical protein
VRYGAAIQPLNFSRISGVVDEQITKGNIENNEDCLQQQCVCQGV